MEAVKLSAAQRARIRRLSQPRELAPDEEGGELNIVPFLDIVVNILIFVLATVAVTFTSTIETTPPQAGGKGVRKDVESTALNLTVFIATDGFSLKGSGGNVAPGCAGLGPGITIPKRGGEYDFAALRDCASKLKAASPDFADERRAWVTGNFDVPFQTIVSVQDALRSDPKGEPMFDDINYRVPK